METTNSQTTQNAHSNGQAFILHIWDNQDCRIDPAASEWSPGWQLVNYLTHQVGVAKRGFEAKVKWLAYVDGF